MDAPYQRLAATLRHRLAAGDWAAGTRFPSLASLSAEYDVDRGVAQRAVGELRREGVLEGRPGSRLTVAYAPAVRTLTDPDAPWPHGMGDVERGTVRPTPELQARLRVDPRVRLHWVRTELLDPDGKPAMLATTWQRGASERNYSRTICELRPHQMTSAEAAALGLPRGTAALLVERSRLDGAGFPVQVADLVLPADRWRVCLPY